MTDDTNPNDGSIETRLYLSEKKIAILMGSLREFQLSMLKVVKLQQERIESLSARLQDAGRPALPAPRDPSGDVPPPAAESSPARADLDPLLAVIHAQTACLAMERVPAATGIPIFHIVFPPVPQTGPLTGDVTDAALTAIKTRWNDYIREAVAAGLLTDDAVHDLDHTVNGTWEAPDGRIREPRAGQMPPVPEALLRFVRGAVLQGGVWPVVEGESVFHALAMTFLLAYYRLFAIRHARDLTETA